MKFHSQVWNNHLFYGWDNVTGCPLLNVILAYPNVNGFIGAIDTTWEHKDAQYICYAFF
jgi:hypothetical protein